MDEQPSLRRTRMRHPTSRWRDPDLIVVPMFGAAFIAIVALITGGSETYLYVEAQADPASRIGVCSAKPVAQCVTITQVYVIGSRSDQVTLRTVEGSQDMQVKRIGGAGPSGFSRQRKGDLRRDLRDLVGGRHRPTPALFAVGG